jgi:hypothetical protein
MQRAIQHAAVTAAACLAFVSHADTLTEALFQGQVQQSFDGDKVASCGVVVSGLELTSTGNALMFNGSFAVYDPLGGLVKGGASEIDAKLVGTANSQKHIRHLQIANVWFKGQGAPRTTVRDGTTINKGEDPRYILYATGLKPLSALLQSISDKQPIQIGVRVAGRKFDQVLFGVVNLSDAQSAQLGQCLTEWSNSVLEKYKAK